MNPTTAEGVGFEPTGAEAPRLFKSRAFVRSAIPPDPGLEARPLEATDPSRFGDSVLGLVDRSERPSAGWPDLLVDQRLTDPAPLSSTDSAVEDHLAKANRARGHLDALVVADELECLLE